MTIPSRQYGRAAAASEARWVPRRDRRRRLSRTMNRKATGPDCKTQVALWENCEPGATREKGPAIKNDSTGTAASESRAFIGLEAHKETVAAAVADSGIGEPGRWGSSLISNDALRSLLRKLGPASRLRVCYEAGPCGHVVQRSLQRLNIDCAIVAPSLIPRKAGDRVKIDRRDALMLVRLLRSVSLQRLGCPDREHAPCESWFGLARMQSKIICGHGTACASFTATRHRAARRRTIRLGASRQWFS